MREDAVPLSCCGRGGSHFGAVTRYLKSLLELQRVGRRCVAAVALAVVVLRSDLD